KKELRTRQAAANKRHRDKLKAQGLCIGCGKSAAEAGKTRCKACLAYHVNWNKKHYPKINKDQRARHQAVRLEVIEKYGGKCKCCKETEPNFLVIDHANGDGGDERRKLFGMQCGSTRAWYGRLKREERRADLRVLCHNCNAAIAFYGKCP